MFGSGRAPPPSAPRSGRSDDRSILDFVGDEPRQLQRGLGAPDRARLGEYLDLRARDRATDPARRERAAADALTSPNAPVGVPEIVRGARGADVRPAGAGLPGRSDARLHVHDGARGQPADLSRSIGVTEPHHDVSHHGNRPDEHRRGTPRSNAHHVGLFAKFLERLRATPDGDGSLLDHSLIVYGSGMSDGNGHTGVPAARSSSVGGGGRVKGNRHHRAARGDADRPTCCWRGARLRRRARALRRQHAARVDL